jgi:hypothetical protein
LFALALAGAFTFTIRHSAAQAAAPQPQAAAKPSGVKGATYYALERQARRVTTHFADAVVTAARDATGRITAHVTDPIGNDLGSLTVDVADGEAKNLAFSSVDRREARGAAPAGVRATLDWGNRQAYSLWKDLPQGPARLEWQDGVGRPARSPNRNLDDEATEIRTEWSGGLVSTARRDTVARRNVLTGARLAGQGHMFSLRLQKDGLEVGTTNWYAEERVLSWSLPGLTEGYVDDARLQKVGGWPFTPDLAWMNVQAFAFHQFHTLMKERGRVADRRAGWLRSIFALWAPTLQANEEGCDDLHWLDDTLFRPCCDVHDFCYEKYGCSSSSWWEWWSSWRCDACNVFVVYCFTTVGRQPYYPFPY